jgi:hypothetical protein
MKKKQIKHGMSDSHFYNKWLSLRRRCSNKKGAYFARYGGRGITFCSEWKHFISFKNDMYNTYIKHVEKYGERNTTIDRIDNNGNYCKENCRWATTREQSLNYSRNRIIEFHGDRKTLTELAEKHGLSYSIVRQRIDKLNWPIEKSLLTKQLKFYDRNNRKKFV